MYVIKYCKEGRYEVLNFILKYKSLPVQIKASFWFFVCAFLQKGISFITTPIFTRLFTTSEYGQFNVFNSWLDILTVFVTLNIYYGVYIRGLVKFEEDKNTFSSSMQGLLFFLVCIWTILYLFFHSFWNNLFGLTTTQMLCMLVIMWTTGVYNFWSAEQRVVFKYRKLIFITLLISFLKPIIGIYFVLNAHDKVTARILSMALINLIMFTGLFHIQVRKGKKLFVWKYWKHALLFNIPLIPHYLSTSILNSADRIMIRDFVGTTEAGIYGLAYSVSMIMTILNTSLMQTIEPWMYTKINEERVEDISKIAYPSFVIVALANLLLIAFAPEVISIFAPSEYFDAIYVIPPIATSVFFMFSYTFFAVFEFYFKRTKLIAFATSVGAILNIFLNYIFIPRFGYFAAGYTTLFCYIIYTIFHYIFMRKICREELGNTQPYNIKIYLMICFIFLSLSFCYMNLYTTYLVRYVLTLVIVLLCILNMKTIYTFVKNIINK